jgi:hypothetical protein
MQLLKLNFASYRRLITTMFFVTAHILPRVSFKLISFSLRTMIHVINKQRHKKNVFFYYIHGI